MYEDDLLATRGENESAGSDSSKESTTVTGTSPSAHRTGVKTLSVGGINIVVNGVVAGFPLSGVTTPLGNTLTITGYNPATGLVSYSYTLNDNEAHPTADGNNSLFEDFAVSLVDSDGDSASNTLSVQIVDDVPTAVSDVNLTAAKRETTWSSMATSSPTTCRGGWRGGDRGHPERDLRQPGAQCQRHLHLHPQPERR